MRACMMYSTRYMQYVCMHTGTCVCARKCVCVCMHAACMLHMYQPRSMAVVGEE